MKDVIFLEGKAFVVILKRAGWIKTYLVYAPEAFSAIHGAEQLLERDMKKRMAEISKHPSYVSVDARNKDLDQIRNSKFELVSVVPNSCSADGLAVVKVIGESLNQQDDSGGVSVEPRTRTAKTGGT